MKGGQIARIADHFDPNATIVLYEGDCLTLLGTIPEETVQLVVTSPPYNIGKEYEEKSSLSAYYQSQKRVIEECYRVLKPEGSICWQVGNYVDNGEILPLDIFLYPIFQELNLQLRNRIIWHYGHGLHATKRFSGRYETILWFTKTDDYYFNVDPIRVPQKYPEKKYFKGEKRGELSCNPLGKNPTDVWDIPNVKANHIEKTIHPAQFPVELIERLVLSMTKEGDWVLDPFCGSGTTQIASMIHQRKAIGAEIEKKYVEIARSRIMAAEKGELRIRPMERPIYDPSAKTPSIHPKIVHTGKSNKTVPLSPIDLNRQFKNNSVIETSLRFAKSIR
ncbi:MAG TPA: site-specific DNA-methyltransferase [Thermotogota bacterium]|nr:site-specific DNA-methyltransferase [Thermotogota bacterium]